MPVIPDDPFGSVKTPAKPGQSPEPKEVNKLHARSDLDSSTESQHHTLGPKANQASPGDHLHDGRASKKLLDGINLPSDSTTASWRLAVEQALTRLGANKLT